MNISSITRAQTLVFIPPFIHHAQPLASFFLSVNKMDVPKIIVPKESYLFVLTDFNIYSNDKGQGNDN